jgi:hypothetical protein
MEPPLPTFAHACFGTVAGDLYKGEWKAGNKEGRGTYWFADGGVYEGEYKQDLKDGRGVFRWADGAIYEGEWKEGRQDGKGTCRWADGTLVSSYERGSPVGEGAQWSARGHNAWRVREGEVQEDEVITLEEACAIAMRIGEPVPGVRPELGDFEA